MSRPLQTQQTDLGTELRCSKCGEYWPMDSEFFFRSRRDGFRSPCKACYYELPSSIRKQEKHERRTSL